MTKAMTIEKRSTPAVCVATVAGVGYFPVLPGTVGSIVGVGIVAALDAIPFATTGRDITLILAAMLIFLVGVWAAGQSEKIFGRTDPSLVVIDEVVGQMVTFLLVPHASWKLLLAGLGLFRFFDIIKPFPVGRAERLPGGWGIMLDDVLAGVYALGALSFLGYILR